MDMVHPLFQQGNDVLIFDAIKHFLAIPPGNYETHLSKTAQMMRYSRLAYAHHPGYRSNVHFMGGKSMQYFDTADVTERTKELCHQGSRAIIDLRSIFGHDYTIYI